MRALSYYKVFPQPLASLSSACVYEPSAQARVDQESLVWEVLTVGDSLGIVIDRPGDSVWTPSFCLLPRMTSDKDSGRFLRKAIALPVVRKYGFMSHFL